eukprot:6654641-Heterocapsa_arctica.AAC.1
MFGCRQNQIELPIWRERGMWKRRGNVADHQRDVLPMTSSCGGEGLQRSGRDAGGRRSVDVHLASVINLLSDKTAFCAAVRLQHLDPPGPHHSSVRVFPHGLGFSCRYSVVDAEL